jgi:ferredoxin
MSAGLARCHIEHNGTMPARFLPVITPTRCTGCGRCVAACGPHVLSLQPQGWVKVAALDDAEGCTGCAQCQVACLFGAVRMERNVQAVFSAN